MFRNLLSLLVLLLASSIFAVEPVELKASLNLQPPTNDAQIIVTLPCDYLEDVFAYTRDVKSKEWTAWHIPVKIGKHTSTFEVPKDTKVPFRVFIFKKVENAARENINIKYGIPYGIVTKIDVTR